MSQLHNLCNKKLLKLFFFILLLTVILRLLNIKEKLRKKKNALEETSFRNLKT